VANGTASTGLVVSDAPTGSQVQGYNTTGSTGAAGDRGIGTAPTGIDGMAIELQMVNNSGAARGGLVLSYDIRRIQPGTTSTRTPPAGIPDDAEELPGYWLFWSLDGTNYTAVRELIPVGEGPSNPLGQPIVPNTVGVTTVPNTSFGFGTGTNWNVGQTLFLRWVDDNAIDPSPDQIYALDNLRVTPVPEPSSLLCVSAVGLLAGGRFIRKRFRRGA